MRRKPCVAASRAKERRPMRVGGRSSALPEEGPFGASRMERGSPGASPMDRRRSPGNAEPPMRVGGACPVSRGHETDPSRKVGRRSSWSAGRRRKSEVMCRRSQWMGRQRKLEVGHRGSWRTQHRLYYRVIKIETPEASVSGVFNLRRNQGSWVLFAFGRGRRFLRLPPPKTMISSRGPHWPRCLGGCTSATRQIRCCVMRQSR